MIFDFLKNGTKIHLLTIGLLIYIFLSVIRHVVTIIMSFYGVFVTFKNLDFGQFFWLYRKRDEPDITFVDAKWSSIMPTKIYKVI